MSWIRSEHEACGQGIEKRYQLVISGTENLAEGNYANPSNSVFRFINGNPQALGNGETQITTEDRQKLSQLGLDDGDDIFWSMRYRYTFGTVDQFGEWKTRRLVLGSPPESNSSGGNSNSDGDNTDDGGNTSNPGAGNNNSDNENGSGDVVNPATPTLIAPINGSVLGLTNKTFAWNLPPNQISVRLCITSSQSNCDWDVAERNVGNKTLYSSDTQIGVKYNFSATSETFSAPDLIENLPALANGIGYWRVFSFDGDQYVYSEQRSFRMRPAAPVLIAPSKNATNISCPLTLSWQGVPNTEIYRGHIRSNSNPNLYLQFETGGTSYTFDTVPPAFQGQAISWDIKACKVIVIGEAEVCSDYAFTYGPRMYSDMAVQGRFTMSTAGCSGPAISFSGDIANAFKAAACVNCHAFNAGQKPPGHGSYEPDECINCHGAALNTIRDNYSPEIQPGWKAAPANFDLRNLTDFDLCQKAKTEVSGHSVLEHLTQDELILWAVDGGGLPNGQNVFAAFPSGVTAWRQKIQDWVEGGMSCD